MDKIKRYTLICISVLTTATEIQLPDINQQSDGKRIQYNYSTAINKHKIYADH